ncbi:HAD-IIA family hydrolase [Nocardioides sp.]|uniref:HAD-IIA family hydrolase n=1 Tax=Nocardioides sp. TaxID=35761 RepID=UPI002733B167|nr:HAD-IIA family hydrolase [Nocardioides sp.]MDP3891477.1 HAD-IIA family hydrolase [Nocardioides sp.]
MLGSCHAPLAGEYDLTMLDLDGVVYVGPDAVPGAPAHLAAARAAGTHLAFITNNASRTPSTVVEHLSRLGVEAATNDVVTSAQAAAHLLAGRLGAGARVALLGGEGLHAALLDEGLEPVPVADEGAVALVSGYGPDVLWRDVMTAAIRIRNGLPWVASNSDLTIPTPQGPGPGHGVLVRTLEEFTGTAPVIAGKPFRHLLDETVRRVGGERPLMVGDRLDTDIEGATNAGHDSLLVLTGVSGLGDLVQAPPAQRPTYLAEDLEGLVMSHPAGVEVEGGWRVGGWVGRVDSGRLSLSGDGAAGDWWRAAASAAWAWLDRTGEVVDTVGLVTPLPGTTEPAG